VYHIPLLMVPTELLQKDLCLRPTLVTFPISD
jgi:hypothetical protein